MESQRAKVAHGFPAPKNSWPLSSEPNLIWALVTAAWGLMFVAAFTGQDHWLHRDVLTEHPSFPLVLKLGIFLGAWLVMTVAMMLPTSLPLIQLFALVKQRQSLDDPFPALLVFLASYFTVWMLFALAAFFGDLAFHLLANCVPWLRLHSWAITGSGLLLAGAFQFSKLKERCLRACRQPLSFLSRYYRRGLGGAWELGVRHGLYCLGCCWALMLVMFALGVGHLTGMLMLTGVMALEKTTHWGRLLVPVVGFGLLLWGAILLLPLAGFPVRFTTVQCVNQ